ncbi:MAG: L-threonylcarbamoyladenylate synthase [Pseudomonadota bacterium]|nr:L-threonylcarbamoyladenylate synthase [Pseudomonadota bacterium]HJO35695.1 L-threonylcarbamoyladenylate synthase [Gammaproteobacteria bacterium]
MNEAAAALEAAVATLVAGGVLAYPTEAVYGIGCDPWQPAALARVRDIKQRPAAQGFILLVPEVDAALALIGEIPAAQRVQMQRDWPGPYTWVCPAGPGVPPGVQAEDGTIALRVSAHPLAAALVRRFGRPLVSTSANRRGATPARTAVEVEHALGRLIDFTLPGSTDPSAAPTTIRDARDGRLLRGS